MTTTRVKSARPKRRPTEQSVLDMTAKQARSFLLKPESYCSLDLPPYFDFGRVLRPVEKALAGRTLTSLKLKPRSSPDVNYTIYSNKDGRFAWRPFQLIHPANYVDLVDALTEAKAWAQVQARFSDFANDPGIKCLSVPRRSLTRQKDRAAQILQWWLGIEQASIELALDYNYVFHADITDCYAAIYTHSIAWAIHGKAAAKAKKHDKTLLGNAIDGRIQDMRHGQTNGIPQGSVLMDLLAELVLGYSDLELSDRLKKAGASDFQILRYRDDYRIFVNSSQMGELILKALTEVLLSLGLKLNASKTTGAQPVVASSLKPEKREWMRSRQADVNLQKQLLLIHSHGVEFPNAGSLHRNLDEFYLRLAKQRAVANPMQLISISIDIAYNSPRCFPACAAIVSKLLSTLKGKKQKLAALARIRNRLDQLPNNGHLEVWLQRISYHFDPKLTYSERLCALVEGKAVDLWDNSWITDATIKAAANAARIVNRSRLKALRPIVPRIEFMMFIPY